MDSKRMRKTAILFDLDGTLLDTLADLADSFNAVMKKYGFPIRTYDEIRGFVGNGVAKLIERGLPDGIDNPYYATCLEEFKAYYAANMQNKTMPYPGIEELLKQLSEEGYPLAVVSNKFDPAVKALIQKYFGNYIPVAIGESSSIRKKPAPDTVLEALRQMQAEEGLGIYVGDSDVDIQTAKNAGLPCISVTWGFRSQEFLLQHGAVALADNTDELLARIRKMEEQYEIKY